MFSYRHCISYKITVIFINYNFRQDRYILIEDCKPLVDFYIGLIELLGRMSFQLTNKNTLTLDPTWKHHPYKSPYQTYASEARKQLLQYYNTHIIKHTTSEKGKIKFFL